MPRDYTAYASTSLKKYMREWNSVVVDVLDGGDVEVASGLYATFLPHQQKLDYAANIGEPMGVSIKCNSFVFSTTDLAFEFELGFIIKATINAVETSWLVTNGQDGQPFAEFDKHNQQILVSVEEND
jgi:hypothetical protein